MRLKRPHSPPNSKWWQKTWLFGVKRDWLLHTLYSPTLTALLLLVGIFYAPTAPLTLIFSYANAYEWLCHLERLHFHAISGKTAVCCLSSVRMRSLRRQQSGIDRHRRNYGQPAAKCPEHRVVEGYPINLTTNALYPTSFQIIGGNVPDVVVLASTTEGIKHGSCYLLAIPGTVVRRG